MNKKLLIIAGAILVVIVVVGVVLMIMNKSGSTEEENNNSNENVIELTPEDVGLTLSSQQNNQQIVMEMNDTSEIESFEYELSYDATENGEIVTQGTFGSGPNEEEESADSIRRVIDLGTCSATCRYHEGVEEVLFTLRVNLSSGETGIIETTHILE